MAQYVKIDLQPGVFKDDTPLSVGAHLVDCDKIRWVRGKAQVTGGWESATTDLVHGICRGLFGWQGNDTIPQAAIGTNTHLQIFYDAQIYDATPIIERGTLTNPFTTDYLGVTTTAKVNDTAHGRALGDRVFFANATAVGGITIAGEYTVTEVLDVDNYTITTAVATAAGPGGGTVYYDYLLAIGLVDNLGGPGYGVGGFSIGDYSTGSTLTEFFPRTWALDNFGPNLVANPRGGGIYELSPAYSAPELVTNGDFSSATGWTFGANWSFTGSLAQATLSSAALSTTITTDQAAYNLLTFDVMNWTTGSINVIFDSQTIIASVVSSGHYRTPFYDGGFTGALTFNGVNLTAQIDNVSVKQLLTAQIVPNAPTTNTCILVTPELICLAGGTIDADTGLFNPMQIRSSDTGDGDLSALHTWIPDPANLSRRWTLAKGSRIVALKNGNGEVLAFTDTALYAGQYTTDTNVVYQWRLVAEGCGLIGPNAVAVMFGAAYWMTPAGQFMAYAGGVPVDLESTMQRFVKDELAPSQGDKIYAQQNTQFGEIDWLVPTLAGDNECAIYAKLNPKQNVWANGTFTRTAWLDTGAFALPLAVGVDGTLYFQEKGVSADGNPLQWSMVTGAIDLGDGNTLMDVLGFISDFEDLQGGCDITFSAYLYPSSAPVDSGPFSITAMTGLTNIRSLGRQCAITFEGNSAPAFMRNGTHRVQVQQSAMQR